MNYNSIIKKVSKKKYQNYLNLNKKFFLSYIKSRSDLIKKLDKIKYTKSTNKQNDLSKNRRNKKIETYKILNLLFKNFKKNKTITNKNINLVAKFYHKFETNLFLRSMYNLNYKKITNKETNLNSYVLLGFLIRKIKNINNLQKINCLIKINDHLSTKKFKPEDYESKKLYLQNIKYEIDYIIKINKS
mgnify:CR=1 FL=1